MKKQRVLALFSCLVLVGRQNDHASFPAADTITTATSEIENLDRFYTFLENFTQKEPDHIKIISYTTEGDPVYRDLQSDGKVIHFMVDRSKDKHSSKEVTETVCTELLSEESEDRIVYLMGDCEDQSQETVLVVRDQ